MLNCPLKITVCTEQDELSQIGRHTAQKVLVPNGFTTGVANNCTFYHPQKRLDSMVHGDDCMSTGSGSRLKW